MAKFPALPLFTDAFIADTIHLSALQTGAYIMLLMAAWRTPTCTLPDDDKILAKYARLDLRNFIKNKPLLMGFWEKNVDGTWYQRRLRDERLFVDERRSKNMLAGKASALKRHDTISTSVQPKQIEISTNPTLNPTLSSKKESSLTPSIVLKPPLPPTNEDKKGVLKFGSEDGRIFSIERLLHDDFRDRAKLLCKALNWDFYHICKIYDEGVNSGTRSAPTKPNEAFIAWIPAYTKNRKL